MRLSPFLLGCLAETMIYAVLAASAIAFAPPSSLHHATAMRASSVTMAAEAPLSRREALFGAAAVTGAPATPMLLD